MGKEEFCKATGLTASQVDTALSLQLLVPKKQEVFDSEDIAVGRMLVEGEKEGIKIKELDFYPRFASEIVDREMKIQDRIIRDKSYERAVSNTLEITRMARIL
jgi:hypothetical protein